METRNIRVGVVGLGLMGSSIVASLLIAGHDVVAISPLPDELDASANRIQSHLSHIEASGLLNGSKEGYREHFTLSADYRQLADCGLVLECVTEVSEIKKSVYRQIEGNIHPEAIIATNTSAIPISVLQKSLRHPERFLGAHWAEPSYLTRFMEITCGEKTVLKHAEWLFELAHEWGKEPTLLKKDLRGFVTNRLMYAVYREAFHLEKEGVASFEDMDKAFRYDAGSWMTLMGVFRRMDFTGLSDYEEIFKNVFPKLCNDKEIPGIMQIMVRDKAKGTQNLHGLYSYAEEEARKWDEAFARFNTDIYKLAAQYPLNKLI
jgi:3-hydroxybutyryl-CoA dehydrogenase